MFKLIKKLFTNSKQSNDLGIQISNDETNFINQTMKAVLVQELDKRDYFNKEHSGKIIEHIFGRIDLNKGKAYLSNEQKEQLGISKRLKISEDLIEIFNKEKIKGTNPKKLLSNLFNQVRNKALEINNLRKLKNVGFKYVRLLNAGGKLSCEWCKKNDNKKIKIGDAVALIDRHCQCDFIRVTFVVDKNYD
ncbi:hypothetical protein [Sulfurovum sp.]|uniref:hypothetical protein n=1 Tax=Sulfurovum sp. TaxID=1969726 RepID=UPI0035616FBE